jgi:hypothetical protein
MEGIRLFERMAIKPIIKPKRNARVDWDSSKKCNSVMTL